MHWVDGEVVRNFSAFRLSPAIKSLLLMAYLASSSVPKATTAEPCRLLTSLLWAMEVSQKGLPIGLSRGLNIEISSRRSSMPFESPNTFSGSP